MAPPVFFLIWFGYFKCYNFRLKQFNSYKLEQQQFVVTLNESNSIICKRFDVINRNETINAIYIQIKDSKRGRRHRAYIYVLLHMFLVLTAEHMNCWYGFVYILLSPFLND